MVTRMHPASKRTSGYRLLPTSSFYGHHKITSRANGQALLDSLSDQRIVQLLSLPPFSLLSLSLFHLFHSNLLFLLFSLHVDFLHITMSSGKGFHERDQRYMTISFSPFAGGSVSFLFATPFSFLPCSTSSSSLFFSFSCSCSAPSSWCRCARFFFFFFCSFSVTVTPASRYASSQNRPKRPIPFQDDELRCIIDAERMKERCY